MNRVLNLTLRYVVRRRHFGIVAWCHHLSAWAVSNTLLWCNLCHGPPRLAPGGAHPATLLATKSLPHMCEPRGPRSRPSHSEKPPPPRTYLDTLSRYPWSSRVGLPCAATYQVRHLGPGRNTVEVFERDTQHPQVKDTPRYPSLHVQLAEDRMVSGTSHTPKNHNWQTNWLRQVYGRFGCVARLMAVRPFAKPSPPQSTELGRLPRIMLTLPGAAGV